MAGQVFLHLCWHWQSVLEEEKLRPFQASKSVFMSVPGLVLKARAVTGDRQTYRQRPTSGGVYMERGDI
jgi:hypothetical protein